MIGLLLYGVFTVGAMGKVRMPDPSIPESDTYSLVLTFLNIKA
jgi:hypothetical protein